MIRKLKLTEINMTAGTQVRAGLNEATVADYAEALTEGAKFPPVVVFHDGAHHLAADGFHRIHAAMQIGVTEIECDVRPGGKADALRFALGCNAQHGLRRTNADKRHAVTLALREFPMLSDVAISELCLVGRELVAEIRKVQVVDSDNLSPATRIGKDGKVYKLPPPPMQRQATEATSPQPSPPAAERGQDSERRSRSEPPHLPPPPPTQVVDATGWPIPTQLIPLWQRSGEVQELLTILSRVRGALRAAQDKRDILFAEVSFSSALSQLDQAWTDVKTAKPFAVCTACQGQVPEQCTLCHGRGIISEFRWKMCVPREDKAFRERARERARTESPATDSHG